MYTMILTTQYNTTTSFLWYNNIKYTVMHTSMSMTACVFHTKYLDYLL